MQSLNRFEILHKHDINAVLCARFLNWNGYHGSKRCREIWVWGEFWRHILYCKCPCCIVKIGLLYTKLVRNKFKTHEDHNTLFRYNINLSCPIILKLYTEHEGVWILCTVQNYQITVAEKAHIDKREFSRFVFQADFFVLTTFSRGAFHWTFILQNQKLK